MRLNLLFASLILIVAMNSASAQSINIDEHCVGSDGYKSLRQTVIIVDGAMIVPDSENGPAVENQSWRAFVRSFLDATDRRISQLMAPRERITVTVANADGSGLSTIFSGCIPLWTQTEVQDAVANNSALKTFIGQDWRSKLEKSQESFRRSATIAMISGIKNVPIGRAQAKADFTETSLIAALRRNPGYSTDDGLVRYIVVGDFAETNLPVSDSITARRKGLSDGAQSGIDFKQSDIHFFANNMGSEASKYQYIDGFILAAGGNLVTVGGLTSTISDNNVPVSTRVFQGTADFPQIGLVPVRLRLAIDENNRVIMSWFQEQRREARSIPLSGALTCDSNKICRYQGDQRFAQVWSENPDPEPECSSEMPMAGMRNLVFKVEGETITGSVSDTICVIVGREQEGLPFSLRELKGSSG